MAELKEYQLTITLESDLIPATSGGHGIYLDKDVVWDEFGLPLIPDKRVKGILRDSYKEVSAMLKKSKIPFEDKKNELFGNIGSNESSVYYSKQFVIENYHGIRKLLSNERVNPEDIKKYFAYKRRHTAIDENGVAKPTSLRSVNALMHFVDGKPLQFKGTVSINEAFENHFALACKNTTGLGSARNRGYGLITISLNNNKTLKKAEDLIKIISEKADDKFSKIEAVSKNSLKDWDKQCKIYELPINLFTVQKVIIPANEKDENMVSSKNYIGASNLRGLIANDYIQHYGADKWFFELFYMGRIFFTDALPYNEEYETTAIPVPSFLEITNEVINSYDEKQKNKKAKAPEQAFVYINAKNEVAFADVKLAKTLHHVLNENTKLVEQVFNYEAIEPNQYFRAFIKGTIADIEFIKSMFADKPEVKLGKAMTSEYGGVKIEFGEYREIEIPEKFEGCAIMTLLSDTVIYNNNGFPSGNVDDIKKCLSPEDISFNKVPKLKLLLVENYIKVRKGKSPSVWAIHQGASFLLNKLPDNYTLLIKKGIGERTNEGFGRVAFFKADSHFNFLNNKKITNNINITNTTTENYKSPLQTYIFGLKSKGEVELLAMQKAEEFKKNDLGNLPHKLMPLFIEYYEDMNDVLENKISPKQKDKLEKRIRNNKSLSLADFILNVDVHAGIAERVNEEKKELRKLFLNSFFSHLQMISNINKEL